MPVKMEITQENGKTEIIELPVHTWHRGDEWIVQYNSTSPLKKVVIDPNKEFPDVRPENNIWTVDSAEAKIKRQRKISDHKLRMNFIQEVNEKKQLKKLSDCLGDSVFQGLNNRFL